jgi:hypothetical protein
MRGVGRPAAGTGRSLRRRMSWSKRAAPRRLSLRGRFHYGCVFRLHRFARGRKRWISYRGGRLPLSRQIEDRLMNDELTPAAGAFADCFHPAAVHLHERANQFQANSQATRPSLQSLLPHSIRFPADCTVRNTHPQALSPRARGKFRWNQPETGRGCGSICHAGKGACWPHGFLRAYWAKMSSREPRSPVRLADQKVLPMRSLGILAGELPADTGAVTSNPEGIA